MEDQPHRHEKMHGTDVIIPLGNNGTPKESESLLERPESGDRLSRTGDNSDQATGKANKALQPSCGRPRSLSRSPIHY